MQTREQMKNWKVVASVATVAALGVSGLAIANPGDATSTPSPIEIEDRRQNSDVTFTSTTQSRFEIVPGHSVSPGDDSLDTPLASANLDSPDRQSEDADSPEVADSPDSGDSPDSVSAPADSPDPADSPADSPDVADSPADSPDVADSADSGDSVDSLDS